MANDLYLDLDKHIQAGARALQTGEASSNDRFTVSTKGYQRMKRTLPSGAPLWDDCPDADAIDITTYVKEYAYDHPQVEQ